MAKQLSSKLLFVGMLLLLALLDTIIGVDFFGDVDDWMRNYQIRDLLADGQWHDLTLPFIAMPEPYVSPWSRLVDLPYLALTFILSPMMGEEQALLLAYQTWPPFMLVGFALAIYAILSR